MDIDQALNTGLPKILKKGASSLAMNDSQSPLSDQFDPESVGSAEAKTLAALASTPLTSAYPEMSSSNAKDDSRPPTGPSLLLSDPSIPKWTSDYSSKRTTGQQSSNASGTHNGLQSTILNQQSVNLSPLSGPFAGMTEHRASAMDHQVGGDHYRKLSIQPVEFIHKNGLGFLAGNVIKYVCRYKAKAGVQDLLKAKHYIEMLIEQERQDP